MGKQRPGSPRRGKGAQTRALANVLDGQLRRLNDRNDVAEDRHGTAEEVMRVTEEALRLADKLARPKPPAGPPRDQPLTP